MPQFSPAVALCCAQRAWWLTCGASLSPPPPGGLRGGERLQADSDGTEAQDTLLRPSTDRHPPAHEEQRSQHRQVHHHRLITRRSASAPERCYVRENAPAESDGFPSLFLLLLLQTPVDSSRLVISVLTPTSTAAVTGVWTRKTGAINRISRGAYFI